MVREMLVLFVCHKVGYFKVHILLSLSSAKSKTVKINIQSNNKHDDSLCASTAVAYRHNSYTYSDTENKYYVIIYSITIHSELQNTITGNAKSQTPHPQETHTLPYIKKKC